MIKYLIIFINFFFLPMALMAGSPAAAAQLRDAEDHFFHLNTGDLRAEAADARKAGKKAILLMYEQEGCLACIYMKKHVLARADVQDYYRKHFMNFMIDIHGSVPIRDFDGREHTEKSYAQSRKVKATPTLVFHDLAGGEIMRIVGPVKEVSEFLLLGEFIASGAYQTSKFADYKQSQRKTKGN
jgi:thioredoxin-related protein